MASTELLATAERLLSRGTWFEAEIAARGAMAEDPADPQAALLAGLAIAAMGEHARAAPVLVLAAAFAPEADHPCLDLARFKPPLPRSLVARQFRACLRLTPNDNRLLLAFAGFLLDNDQAEEAEQILSDAAESAACHHLRGLAQAEQNLFPSSADSFERAVALQPDLAASWSNLGMVRKIEGLFAAAITAHDRAVALEPGNPRFRVNRAVALLKAGQWEGAWRDYEARWELTGALGFDPARLMPTLRPNHDLAGLTILALHEDGFGDTLQFLRYLPLLADRGARVVACVPPALGRLMQSVPGVAEVVTDSRSPPPYDFICPMFSLPRVFGSTVQTIPPMPALIPDVVSQRRWKGRLPVGGLLTGLVWAGQARPSLPGFRTLDKRRSAGLASFTPLFDVPGVKFISLQAGPAARDIWPSGQQYIDPMRDVKDFADTAAIIAGLDVVVSVDTSVVHLAGLMGKPVFLLDRYDGCWRWLSGRRDSPWYPDLTIFRQEHPGDWSGPMAAVAASLRAMALFHGFGTCQPGSMRERAFVA